MIPPSSSGKIKNKMLTNHTLPDLIKDVQHFLAGKTTKAMPQYNYLYDPLIDRFVCIIDYIEAE